MTERDALLAAIPAELRTRDVCGVLDGMDSDCSTMPILLDAIRDTGGTEDHVLAVVRSMIYGVPKADAPRLWYADWLEERGEVERAEFIRVQVKLSVPTGHCYAECRQRLYGCPYCHRDDELRRRERELWHQLPTWKEFVPWALGIATETDATQFTIYPNGAPSFLAIVSRGFIVSVTLDWQTWLRHHERLFWSPRQTVECPDLDGSVSAKCSTCDGTGRIPRPFVPTAQPIETVRLTTWPMINGGLADLTYWMTPDGYRFDRVKCGMCYGLSRNTGYDTCPSCHGRPLNRWECEVWPGAQFVMPMV